MAANSTYWQVNLFSDELESMEMGKTPALAITVFLRSGKKPFSPFRRDMISDILIRIILVIIVAAVFLMNPSSQPVKIPAPSSISAIDFVAPTTPQPPSCTIAINGQKVPPFSIQLSVMADTCIAGDVTALTVSVNGAQKGMLGTSPGASGTFTGTSGTNSVTVVAKFANGAEQVVFQNAAL